MACCAQEIRVVLKKVVGVIFMFFLHSYLYGQNGCILIRLFFRFQSWRLLKILVVLFLNFSELC